MHAIHSKLALLAIAAAFASPHAFAEATQANPADRGRTGQRYDHRRRCRRRCVGRNGQHDRAGAGPAAQAVVGDRHRW